MPACFTGVMFASELALFWHQADLSLLLGADTISFHKTPVLGFYITTHVLQLLSPATTNTEAASRNKSST